MKLKRYQKWLLRVPLYAALMVLLLFVFFYFFPVSGVWLNRRLEEALARELGRPVIIREASLFLARGRLVLPEVIVPPPNESGKPLSISGVVLSFSPASLISALPKRVRELCFTCATELPFILRENRLTIDEKYRHIVPLLRQILAAGRRQPKFHISRVRIDLAALNVNFHSVGEAEGEQRRLLRITPLRIVLTSDWEGLRRIAAEGNLRSELDGGFNAIMSLRRDGSPAHIKIRLSHLLLSEKTIPKSGFRIEAADLSLDEELECYPSSIRYRHTLSTGHFSLSIPGVAKSFYEDQIHLTAGGNLEIPARKLNIGRAKLLLADSRLTLAGSIVLKDNYAFSAFMEHRAIPRRVAKSLKRLILPPEVIVELQPNSLNLSMIATGKLTNLKGTQFRGVLQFSNVAVRHQGYPLPLTDLAGQIVFNNRTLAFSHISGKFGGGDVFLDGSLLGDNDVWHPEKLLLSWRAGLNATDVLTMIKQQYDLGNCFISGLLNTKGIVEMHLAKKGEITSATLVRLTGSVELNDTLLKHPALPGEIHNLCARFTIRRNSIKFSKLKGSLPGAAFSADGAVEGKTHFWKSPIITARIATEGDIKNLLEFAPEVFRRRLLSGKLKGNAAMQIKLHGPLLAPHKLSCTGGVTFQDISFYVNQPFIRGRIKGLGGRIHFDPGHILFEKFEGKFAGMNFGAKGKLDTDSLRISLGCDLDIEKMRKALPLYSRDFRGSGTLEVSSEILLAAPNLISEIKNLRFPENLRYSFTGAIRASGASLSYKDMPADITHINGIMTFSDRGIKTRDLKLWCGRTQDCTGECLVKFHSTPPLIKFKLYAPEPFLGEWTGQWGGRNPNAFRNTMQDLTSSSPTIEVDGTVFADKMHFGRLEGKQIYSHFIYNYYAYAPNKFSLEELSANAYGGKIEGSANFIFPTGTFYYGVTGQTQDVEVQPLLTALRGKKENLTGIATSTVTIAGEAKKPDTINGSADFFIKHSHFISNVILMGLGDALHSTLFDDITFTKIKGKITIADGTVHLRDIEFASTIGNMSATGSVDFHEKLDIICFLIFRKRYLLNLPVIKQLTNLLELMGKAALKFHITGHLEDPTVTPVPLSADEIINIFLHFGQLDEIWK